MSIPYLAGEDRIIRMFASANQASFEGNNSEIMSDLWLQQVQNWAYDTV